MPKYKISYEVVCPNQHLIFAESIPEALDAAEEELQEKFAPNFIRFTDIKECCKEEENERWNPSTHS